MQQHQLSPQQELLFKQFRDARIQRALGFEAGLEAAENIFLNQVVLKMKPAPAAPADPAEQKPATE